MRRITLLALCVVAAASCGGRQEVRITPAPAFAEAGDISLQEPAAAAPVYSITLDEPVTEEHLHELQAVPGVATAAPLSVVEVEVEGPRRVQNLRVAAVDPLAYRPLAPPGTREADFVWTALLGGEAVVSFEAAERLGIEDAGRIEVGSGLPVGVGAIADNGAPNLAGVLVDARVAPYLDLPPAQGVVIGAEDGTVVGELGRRLAAAAPEARLDRLFAGDVSSSEGSSVGEPQPASVAQGGLVGTMRYKVLPDGFIKPNRAWLERNIAVAEVPVLGSVTCHRVMVPQLSAALAEIESEGLSAHVDPGDYGGCYVPRFVDRDPDNPLSMHAFGLAVDINVSSNPVGTAGNMEPRVIEIFEKWGFEWGGRWSHPDPMHFELARVMRVSA
ncbi:MAG: M15 family metallopeptidase [Actinomycetota bacterium]